MEEGARVQHPPVTNFVLIARNVLVQKLSILIPLVFLGFVVPTRDFFRQVPIVIHFKAGTNRPDDVLVEFLALELLFLHVS